LEYEKENAVEYDIHPKAYLSMFEIPGGGELRIKPF
jgi:hypothetical protein